MNKSTNLVNNTPTNINRNNVENNQTQKPPEYKLLKDKLKPIKTIEMFQNKNIDKRIYLTRVNTKINKLMIPF